MRQPNRRDMLKTSAAVGAGFWLGTSPEVRAQSRKAKILSRRASSLEIRF
jgi:hypothetical protein